MGPSGSLQGCSCLTSGPVSSCRPLKSEASGVQQWWVFRAAGGLAFAVAVAASAPAASVAVDDGVAEAPCLVILSKSAKKSCAPDRLASSERTVHAQEQTKMLRFGGVAEKSTKVRELRRGGGSGGGVEEVKR